MTGAAHVTTSGPEELGILPVLGGAAEVRRAFGHFPSGIVALAAELEGVPVGLVATSFSTGVSFDPPLVLFSVQNSSTTWPVLRLAPRIGASVLGRRHESSVMRLASRSGDRFEGLETVTTEDGAIFLHGSALWLDCVVRSETPAGDHAIVLLEVVAMRVETEVDPLVYHGAAVRRLDSRA